MISGMSSRSSKANEHEHDRYWITYKHRDNRSNYVRIVRASEGCTAIGCHNINGSAAPFSHNEAIGAIVVQTPARELNKTFSLNRLWIIVAGLLAGTGAVVTFYIIVQRVILRPVRQLRALANNVAEGNLDVRSAIKTRDEYERLAEAFNKMLDRLQESQEKLRQANRQLDAKIVELSDRNIELFKANKIKSEFLANMSHEFRTPLNAILGFAEIFREKTDSLDAEKARRYAEHIITSGRQLLSMINDLLELAKAEAGKIELHIEKTSVPELCRGLAAFFSPLTEKKKIKLRLTVDETIPLIQTDPGKVQQILYNLMSNAIKFTPDNGRIEINASLHDEKTIRIAVTDSGAGIAGKTGKRYLKNSVRSTARLPAKPPAPALVWQSARNLPRCWQALSALKAGSAKVQLFGLIFRLLPLKIMRQIGEQNARTIPPFNTRLKLNSLKTNRAPVQTGRMCRLRRRSMPNTLEMCTFPARSASATMSVSPRFIMHCQL